MKKSFLILAVMATAACNQPTEQIAETIDTAAVAVVDTTNTITTDTVAIDTVQ